MKKWGYRNGILCLLLAALLSLPACGKEERERGIDGYVYVAEQLAGTEHWGQDVKNSDSGLYYMDEGVLYRIPLGEDGSPEGTRGEKVPGGKGMYDYTVDAGGNVYYYSPVMDILDSGNTELKGGTLTRYREDGSQDYCLSLEGRSAVYTGGAINPGSLVVGSGNRLFLMMGDAILVVDQEGTIVSAADISGIRPGMDWGTEKLMEGEDGRVYYLVSAGRRSLYELVEDGSTYSLRSCSLNGLETEGRSVGFDFYGSRQGVMYSSTDGILYRYSAREDAWQELLRWGDSNLGRAASEVLWLPGEKLLTSYQIYKNNSSRNEFYLLDRRRVEELPEREELVMACWDSLDADLEDAVIRFNRESDRYHITVQLYEDEDWLDAKLVSSDPPDMLVLLPLNVRKYGGKQILEDLDPYLVESSMLDREDFLAAPLEGYTIEGRLVGIPSEFVCHTLVADRPAAGTQAGWSLEDIMALTEQYPHRKLNGNYILWNLKNLCGDYIMDTFIDRDNGVCHLDTEEFRSLLLWLEESCGNLTDPSIIAEVENPLIFRGMVRNIVDYMGNVSRLGDDMISMGYPSLDGSPRYQAGAFRAVGIISKSRHKEGAWQFIEYFLCHQEADYGVYASMPTRRDLLEEVLEDAMTPWYVKIGDEISLDEAGNPIMLPKWTTSFWNLHGEYVWESYEYATKEEVDGLIELISQADFSPEDGLETAVMDIIAEEAGSYLDGSKSLEEVTKIIQGRVSTLVQENM